MKRIASLASMMGLGLLLCGPSHLAAQNYPPPPPAPIQQEPTPPAAWQNHVEVGAFGDYLHYGPGNSAINFVGVGGRLGINVARHTVIEGEMSYDFARNYTTTFGSGNSGGVSTTFTTTGLRPLTGLFGPTFYLGSPSMHAFVTGKAGFINFTSSNPNNVSTGTVSTAVGGVGGPGTHVAFYPGGGLEGFWGFFGLRAEAGDEVYLDNGAYNNVRATFGPVIRF
jgi:hypothetical protein